MKTKRLIELLQQADPTGEEECTIDGVDIGCVYSEAGYYDGAFQILTRNENNKIVSAKYSDFGTKILIRPMSIEDCIFDNPDFPVEFNLYSSRKERYQKRVDKYRADTKEIYNNVERENFVNYIKSKCVDIDNIEEIAIKFYNENLSYVDSIPQDLLKIPNTSYNDKRWLQWDREIVINHTGQITKKHA